MGFLSSSGKGDQQYIAIFDIGSGSIGGAFVSIEKGKVPQIIFSTRKNIPFQEKLNFQRFFDSMVKTLEEMFVEMQKASNSMKVTKVFCVLASPWYASQTRLIHYEQATPFTITEKGLNKLINKEIELFRDSNLFARAKTSDALPEIMESKNIQMKLNGYEVREPHGKRTSKLDIALYISMIPANIHKSIEESIAKFWHVGAVHFSSFSFTTFDTIRDIFTDESSFLFIDISSEVTDISLAKDNVLLESISFPVGKNMLIRTLVEETKTTPAAAASELTIYLEGKCTRDHAKQMEDILEGSTKEWREFLENALAQFASEFPIPRTIFYTADDDVAQWFEKAMSEVNFSRFSKEENSFIVRSLGNAFLGKFVQISEPSFQDPFLSIETIFANKFTSLVK